MPHFLTLKKFHRGAELGSSSILPRQYKPFWDRDHENFEVEVWPPMSEYVPPSYSVEEELSEWSLSWKICIPQRLEWDDIQTVFNCKDEVLWSRRQCSNYDYSLLSTEILSEKLWGRSWRFMKGHELSLLKAPKTDKTKWHLFSKIDKTNPFAPTWSKSAKLAKTQPRGKAGSTSGAESKVEAGNISLKWVESWTVSNDSLNSQMGKVSWSDWVNSWRFLLASYSPEKKELSCKSLYNVWHLGVVQIQYNLPSNVSLILLCLQVNHLTFLISFLNTILNCF